MAIRSIIFAILFALAVPLRAAEPMLIASPGPMSTWNFKFTPDGKYVFTHGTALTLWDVESGKVIAFFPRPESTNGGNFAFDISPDGKFAVTGGWNGVISTFEIPSGKLVRQYRIPPKLHFLSFAPDGKTVISSHDFGGVRIWNFEDGEVLRTIRDGVTYEAKARFTPSGKQFVTFSKSQFSVWNLEDGKLLHQYGDGTSKVEVCDFSRDGKRVAFPFRGGIKIVAADTGESITEIEKVGGRVSSIQFSPDGGSVLAATTGKISAQIWNVNSGRPLVELEAGELWGAIFHPDGKSILTRGPSDEVVLIDIATGKEIRDFVGKAERLGPVWSPDGSTIVFGTENQMRIWDLKLGREVVRIDRGPIEGYGPRLIYSRDSSAIINVGLQATYYDLKSGKKLSEHPLFSAGEKTADWQFTDLSPSGGELLIKRRTTSYILDAATGKEVQHFDELKNQGVLVSHFSPKGDLLLITDEANGIKLRSIASGDIVREMSADDRAIHGSFSPDGKKFVLTFVNNSTRLFETATFKEICRLDTKERIDHTAFSSDGDKILTSGREPAMYDAATGKRLFSLVGHRNDASAIFSPNGKFILTGSSDASARLWDAPTGKHLATIYSFTDNTWAVITPDNHYDSNEPTKNPNLHWVEDGKVIPLDKFAEKFYTKGLLQELLK